MTIAAITNRLLDENAAPDRVGYQFQPPAEERSRLAVPTRQPSESHEDSTVEGASVPSLFELIDETLRRAGYPRHRIRCWSDRKTLVLAGVTTTYYQMQIALSAAIQHAGHRAIDNRIKVVTGSLPSR